MREKREVERKDVATIWVTRWALTKGILAVKAELTNDRLMATYKVGYYPVYVHRNDFHLTEEAAKARANEMVAKKIASTEKTLAKLKKLAF